MKKKVSRREMLVAGGLALGAQVRPGAAQEPPPRPLQEVVPIKGKAGPGLEPFDAAGTVHEVRQLVESFEKHPDIDLFKEFA